VNRCLLFIVAVVLSGLIAGPVAGRTMTADVTWEEQSAFLVLRVTGEPTNQLIEAPVKVHLADAKGEVLWDTTVTVPLEGSGPWSWRTAIENIERPSRQHELRLVSLHAPAAIDYRETLKFSRTDNAVQGFGLRQQGVFPDRRVEFVIRLASFRGKDLRPIPVAVNVRDANDNAIISRQTTMQPVAERQSVAIDITPEVAEAIGPFSFDATIESDAYGLFFNASDRFAHPNAVAPATDFEHADPTRWFAAGGQPNYRTGRNYYAPHLRDLSPDDHPGIHYDEQVVHTGRRSLRLDYEAGRQAVAWSLEDLPGKPLMARIWVRGNGGNDRLIVHWEDRVNYPLPAWYRAANFSHEAVCTLDFEGWRQFRVPVLGDGMQVEGIKGSTENVDAPIRLMAFSIEPGRLPEGVEKGAARSVWIDGIRAETQVPAGRRVHLALARHDDQGRLTAEASITAAVTNGYAEELTTGRLSVVAREIGRAHV